MHIYRVIKRIYFEITKAFIPRNKRVIKRVSLADFDINVFANEDVGRKIFLFKTFEKNETEFFRNNIFKDDVCFDVGGNIGYFSLLFAKLAFNGSVYAFEPISKNAQMIKSNCDLNEIKNIDINEIVLGDKNELVSFSVSKDSAFSSINATRRVDEQNKILVPMIKLEDFANSKSIERIDILKIDVEGAEDLVLEGALSVLSNQSRRPRIIMIELYDPNLSPYGSSKSGILNKMNALGYRPYVINEKFESIPYESVKNDEHYNIIFKLD